MKWLKQKSKRIYLDHAATTAVSPEVLTAMQPYFSAVYGNPSAVHHEGQVAKAAVEEARTSLGRTLRVRPSDVTFTSGGTESNNLAIYGSVRACQQAGTDFSDMEIISTKIEHPSITEVLQHVAELGVTVKYIDVQEDGRVDLAHFETLLTDKTVLITLAYVNSEIGVIQPVRKLARLVKAFNTAHSTDINVHLDACQAPLWLPVQLDSLGCDLLTLDAGKCHGPKGSGALARKHSVSLTPIMLGGSQESGLRAGTENTPLVVGCATAVALAQEKYEAAAERTSKLRDYLIAELTSSISDCVVNGSIEDRVANNVNISIPEIDSEFAVVYLDTHGVAASTKSACSGADGGGSTVVREISGDEVRAQSTIRFSLGTASTKAEIDTAVQLLTEHVTKMRTFQESLT